MKPMLLAAACLACAASAGAQGARPGPARIPLALESRTEGLNRADGPAARLLEEIRRGFAAIADVEIVPSPQARRTVWMVVGGAAGPVAASVIVSERYDRETLMVLGIEDDDLAERMMALQIVNDHQIFTGPDVAEVARRIVAAVNDGVLARVRARARMR